MAPHEAPRFAAPARPGPNLALVAVGLAVFAGFVALFLADRAAYGRLIDLWSFRPFRSPFVDAGGIAAQIRCWRLGVDVYAANPCDVLQRTHNYSPLWLRLPLPASWVGAEATPVVGVILDTLFLLSLAVLPRPRRRADAAPLLLALVSPFSVFAMERGNADLLMFALVAVAVACLGGRGPIRLGAYAAIMLAGLLKFYPCVLLAFLLRERPALFALLLGVCVAILGAFVWTYHVELVRVAAVIPTPTFADDGFGAAQVPTGLVVIEHFFFPAAWRSDALEATTWLIGTVALYAVAVAVALRIGGDATMAEALRRLSPREATCLGAGALVVAGCFFAGASVGYRAVFLLFTLPGLLALGHVASGAGVSRVARRAVAAALLVMWCLPVQRIFNANFGRIWRPDDLATVPWGTPIPGIVLWLAREALWWFLVMLLLGVLIHMLRDSRIALSLTRAPGQRVAASD